MHCLAFRQRGLVDKPLRAIEPPPTELRGEMPLELTLDRSNQRPPLRYILLIVRTRGIGSLVAPGLPFTPIARRVIARPPDRCQDVNRGRFQIPIRGYLSGISSGRTRSVAARCAAGLSAIESKLLERSVSKDAAYINACA
jgi:hypothetical protein